MTNHQPLRQADIDRYLEGISERGRNELAARAMQAFLVEGCVGAKGVRDGLKAACKHYLDIRIAKRRHRAASGRRAA